jgi:hypothetical protein
MSSLTRSPERKFSICPRLFGVFGILVNGFVFFLRLLLGDVDDGGAAA